MNAVNIIITIIARDVWERHSRYPYGEQWNSLERILNDLILYDAGRSNRSVWLLDIWCSLRMIMYRIELEHDNAVHFPFVFHNHCSFAVANVFPGRTQNLADMSIEDY